jgi:hypothetical protein
MVCLHLYFYKLKEMIMNFYQAIKLVNKGKKVTCNSWNKPHYVYLNKDGFLCLFTEEEHIFTIRNVDIDAIDWKVVE